MPKVPATSADLAPELATGGYVADLSTPLLMFNEIDLYTLDHATAGVLITGQTGSGKSSSSGELLAKTYLSAGFGGLVLTVNVDEADKWRRYAAETNRTQSLIVMDGSLQHRFNFLEYQMAIGRNSAGEAVNVLVEILDATSGRLGQNKGDDFWDVAMRQILTRTIVPLWAAYGRLTLADMMKFIHSRPLTPADCDPAHSQKTFWGETMALAIGHGVRPLDPEDFRPVFDYWTKEMTQTDQRTPGNIVQTLTAKLDPLQSGELRKLLCTYSSFVPDMTSEGAVVILDLSAHAWGSEGVLAQHIVKRMWQKAMQLRPKTPDVRPCFLWADEAQYFLSSTDAQFSQTARACKALTVYLTQNLSGVYAKIGGSHPEHVADNLLGNLALKIFHTQDEPRTSEWAASMIGKTVTWRQNVGESDNSSFSYGASGSTNTGAKGQPDTHSHSDSSTWSQGGGTSRGASEVIDYRVQPSHFGTLKKGGGPDKVSEAIVFQAGRLFEYTRSTWTPVLFRQT